MQGCTSPCAWRPGSATEEGFLLSDGQLVEGGVFVWAGGVKAPELVAGSQLPTGHNGRVKVDQYLRVLDHPEIYVAGDLASVTDPRTGHVVPPLAQVALEKGETVARNLDAALRGRPLEAFTFHDKGARVGQEMKVSGHRVGGQLEEVGMGVREQVRLGRRQGCSRRRGLSAGRQGCRQPTRTARNGYRVP